ncbi:MAG TPA: DUF547 domain-containing protein [Vicinamibacteria bacterium]|nr:DUF547 domain-containing protein [Vicinamibacteria bacterium]
MPRIRVLGSALLPLVFAAACGAPRATAVQGEIAAVIDRGIAEGSDRFDHALWDAILRANAKSEGRRFDYTGLKEEEERLDAYLHALAGADLARLTASELQALFINAYNAYTVKSILDHVKEDGAYEIESIRDIADVFVRKRHVVGGFELSLDNIEHDILRPVFRDPRVHFAVNCASISCPPLPVRAFDGERLDEQLEAATKNVLTDAEYVSVVDDALLVTKIFEWYGEDFVNPEFRGSEPSLAAFIRKYADDPLREWITSRGEKVRVRFRDYDWGLNRST